VCCVRTSDTQCSCRGQHCRNENHHRARKGHGYSTLTHPPHNFPSKSQSQTLNHNQNNLLKCKQTPSLSSTDELIKTKTNKKIPNSSFVNIQHMYNFTKSPIYSDTAAALFCVIWSRLAWGVGHHRLARFQAYIWRYPPDSGWRSQCTESSMHRVSIGVRPTPDPTVSK